MNPPRPAASSPRNAVIIGGGVGGLSAAIHLAADGWRVRIIEQNPQVGGKLNRWIAPHPGGGGAAGERPFTFDTGPSLLTLPFVFERLFERAGTRMSDELDLVRLDPVSRFVWADGTAFELRERLEDTLEEVRRLSPQDVEGWRALHERGRRIWELAGELFLLNSPEQVMSRRLSPRQGLAMATVPFRIGMFSRFSKLVDRHVRHPKLRDVLYQYATYSGASPWKAPATLGVIPFVEAHFGGWYIMGGMYRLAEALERVARWLGVTFELGRRVEEILISPAKPKPIATGVRLEGGATVAADVVIANSDVISTYRKMISPEYRPKWQDSRLDRLDPGGSGMVLLLGVEGTYPHLAHHTKFMPADYLSDLRAMFASQTIPGEPCIYVCAGTRTDLSQAPPGCENLFVLVSAPPMCGEGARIDWSVEGDRYRDRVIGLLEHQFGLSGLSRRIVVESRFTPQTLAERYDANAGSIYGIGSNSRRQAFLRPPNREGHIDRLFFVGGATHPGGGLPLVALSGKIVSELVGA